MSQGTSTTDPAIALSGLGKRYRMLQERATTLGAFLPFRKTSTSDLWALRDLDLRIDAGETVGLIGRNGAGKSSLLRLLAGVSQPTEGCLEVRGRVAPLLSVGVGFHPEMTGRENVFVNAMLLGLNRSEVVRRFDAIVEFAELENFIDSPVKFYSSGMFMRLGFSVAVHVQPDVLLVDEVIAVGDSGFQFRCLERMRALHGEGTTIVFVSHHVHAVHLLCPRTVVLHRGRLEFDGPTDSAIARYHQLVTAEQTGTESGHVEVVDRQLLLEGRPAELIQQGEWLTYRTVLRFNQVVDGAGVCFRVVNDDAIVAYSMQTPVGERWRTFHPGDEATVDIGFRARLGGGGTYRISIDVTDSQNNGLLRDVEGPCFYVPPRLGVTGPSDLEATITIDGEDRTNHRWSRFGGEALEDRPSPSGSGSGSGERRGPAGLLS